MSWKWCTEDTEQEQGEEREWAHSRHCFHQLLWANKDLLQTNSKPAQGPSQYIKNAVLCFYRNVAAESYARLQFLSTRLSDYTCRHSKKARKAKEVGVVGLVNYRGYHPWHVTVKFKLCISDIKLLSFSLHLYHLPWEVTSINVATVYIPLPAVCYTVYDVITSVAAKLQTKQLKCIRDDNWAFSVCLPLY